MADQRPIPPPTPPPTPPATPPPADVNELHRSILLRQLQCPFQGKTPGESELYCIEMISRSGCPFGHRTKTFGHGPLPKQNVPKTPLIEVPPGMCIDHLLRRCPRPMVEVDKLLPKCTSGLHITMYEMKLKFALPVYLPEPVVSAPAPVENPPPKKVFTDFWDTLHCCI